MSENRSLNVFEVKNLVSAERIISENGELTPILNNLSFNIEKGKSVGIFSRNKRESLVLIEILGNMRSYYKGDLYFNENIISEKKKCSLDDLFYIDSSSLLYDHMNLLEELMFVSIANKKHNKKEAVYIQKEMLDLITSVGLSKYVLVKISEMRECMKLVILTLLACLSSSMTIVCNFHNHNFNLEEIEILNHIISKFKEKGKTFVFSSDSFDVISRITDKLLILNEKGIVSYKEKEKIFEDYNSLTFYIDSSSPSKTEDLVKRLNSNIKFTSYIKGSKVYFKDVDIHDIVSTNLVKSLEREHIDIYSITSLKEKVKHDLQS